MTPDALLVIDIQRGAFDGMRCPVIDRAAQLVSHASMLVAAARESGTPVVFIQHLDEAGSAFEADTPHGELHADLTPLPGEAVIRKRASSAFESTGLAAVLQQLGARRLIVCGLQSEFCVSNTTKAALALGFGVRVAQDGHSTWASQGRTAQAISEGVNADLKSLGAVLGPTAELAAALTARA